MPYAPLGRGSLPVESLVSPRLRHYYAMPRVFRSLCVRCGLKRSGAWRRSGTSTTGLIHCELGAATAALAAGVSPQQIRVLGRWPSDVYV